MSKKLLLSAVIAILVLSSLIIGAIASRLWFQPETSIRTVITSQIILTALRDQGFLVTQTYLFDQPVTIKKTTGSLLKDFFVGQTIEARGTMEANLGLDLSKLTEADVTASGKEITVRVARPVIFNTRLVGPIEVRNTQGILKRLLEPDDGYNIALLELTKAAEDAANQPDTKQRAEEKAVQEIDRLVKLLVEKQGFSVKVIVKD